MTNTAPTGRRTAAVNQYFR